MTQIMAGAEPFGFEGGETGVLLVHGFTGSPQGLRLWGEALASHGYTVLCPRLPGHGTNPKDLAGTTWRDWVGEAEMSLRGVGERCSSVFVAGLSMGATIALDLAARNPDRLAGVIAVNPSVYSDDPRARLAPVLGRVNLFVKGLGNDVADPGQRELTYPKVSTRASASVLQYMRQVKARLADVRIPALVFASRNDHVVPPGNASYVVEHVSSAQKELVWLERSYHVATLDYDRDLIFDRSAKFVAEHARP
jgi:carboxylesterase